MPLYSLYISCNPVSKYEYEIIILMRFGTLGTYIQKSLPFYTLKGSPISIKSLLENKEK